MWAQQILQRIGALIVGLWILVACRTSTVPLPSTDATALVPPAPATASPPPAPPIPTRAAVQRTATPLPPALTPTQLPAPEIESSRSLGTLKNPPSIVTRDGAASAIIGGNLLWFFGDTIFHPKSVDGTNGRSNTVALADVTAPFVLHEPLDANGAPFAFLPFTPEEQQYNDSPDPPDNRIALWPGSLIPDGQGGGIVYYLKLRVGPGFLNYTFLGSGLAHVRADSTVAVREPGLLFEPPQPTFDLATVVGTEVYVYGALPGPSQSTSFAVARVPLSQVSDREAYRFWNGRGWVTEVEAATPVLHDIPGEMTVSFNPYLGRYLAVHSGIFSNKVFMRIAERPEGPWSEAIEAFTGLEPAKGSFNYAGREHPELAAEGGRRIVVSYYRPLGGFRGEVQLVEVTLK